MKVLVLGGSGMLGSMMVDVLAHEPDLDVRASTRLEPKAAGNSPSPCGVEWISLDAERATSSELAMAVKGCSWVLNCIGIIKHAIDERRSEDIEKAIRINALFPHTLAQAAAAAKCQVIQIATDCVYAGTSGGYREDEVQDALDVYGRTKSLGEASVAGMHHLRCSIIGPEQRGRRSLLEWFLGQPLGGRVTGYTNHFWNGVTTLHFARICRGIMVEGIPLPFLAHVVPGNALSKGELLQRIAQAYGRTDIQIDQGPASVRVDRTLQTVDPGLNRRLWAAAGYQDPPTLETMVAEMAQHPRAEKGVHP